jgi:A/G-specific adenine glycosylase
MGPAIRHAAAKLGRQPEVVKVLIVVSDGYPQDSDYGPDRRDEEYGIQDTARALREAADAGISTFCVTIDPAGHDYLQRMCEPDRYMVIDDVAALPGIGRSTAGAILALAYDERQPILDGNVKRVLGRLFAIEGNAAQRAVEQRLWALADACTPAQDVAIYTQAIMDLGATVCSRRNPACVVCPVTTQCLARAAARQHEIPSPKPRAARKARPARACWWLLPIDTAGRVLLERRPERGIWGGLWCPLQFDTPTAAESYARQRFAVEPAALETLGTIDHAFTHFDLSITPLLLRDVAADDRVMEPSGVLWYNPQDGAMRIGLPAPAKQLLDDLLGQTFELSRNAPYG